MAIQSIWVHGNTVRTQETTDKLKDVPYREHSALLGFPQGEGITFRGIDNKKNWFHFCIPTPCFRKEDNGASHRAKLDKIFVLFKAQRGVNASAIHVWDGSKRIFEKNGLAIGGDHSTIDNTNAWKLPNSPDVLYGLGISVEISFDDEGEITFVSAGADFQV